MLRRTFSAISGVCLALSSLDSYAAETRPPSDDTSLYLEADRDAEKLLATARAEARTGNWRAAVEAYQRVADYAGKAGAQPLVASQTSPAVYLTVQQAAALELAKLPRPALETYRQAYDTPAKALLDRGVTARDVSVLETVALRYLASSWGDDALMALGSLAFERADFVGALSAWGRLLDACAEPSVPLHSVLARMWVCHKMLGHTGAALAIAERLRAQYAAKMLRVAGEDLAVAAFLGREVTPPTLPPLGSWPALGGDATHARVAAGFEDVGGLAWRFPLPHAAAWSQSPDTGESPYPIAMPMIATVRGPRAFLADHDGVYALNLETGTPAWLFPDAPEHGPAPILDETLHAVACSDGRAFVRMAQGLAAFDEATGRLLWRKMFAHERREPAPEEKPAEEPPQRGPEEKDAPRKAKGRPGKSLGAKSTLLLTPPVVAGARVYVGITHLGEEARASLVALDAATGQELWRTFACSRSIPAFLGMGATPAPPAVSGGTVYYATNLGAVAAVDAATGALRWVHRYASFPTHLRRSVLERNERWTNIPPIVSTGMVLLAPQDASSVLALDAVSGSLAWSAPRQGARYLLGVDEAIAFAVGSHVAALDALTGRRLWEIELPGAAAAWPALCRGRLYVPTGKALLAVQTPDGTLATARLWQPGEAPGNVTVGEHALLVATRDRLCAYSDWAGTLAALAPRRDKDPNDPLLPLIAGLHELERGEWQAAIPLLENAHRLADARKDQDSARRARQALFAAWRALGEQGDDTALAKSATLADTPQGGVAALLALACRHEERRRPAEAIAAYHRTIAEFGATPCRIEGGLTVAAQALAAGEIARMIRTQGRAPYRAIETAAAKQLAEAETEAALEAVVRTFPNSAAAEQAMLRLLARPNAKALAPHLASLAQAMPADAASEARAALEAKFAELSRDAGTGQPMSPRWQVQTRIAHQRLQVLSLPGAPPGLIYFATGRRSFERTTPYDAVECRRADTGQLVWQREVDDWNGLALFAGGQFILAAFDQLRALDPATGMERWTVALAETIAEAPPEPKVAPRPPPAPGLDPEEEAPWRPLPRRRAEHRRVVALAAGRQTLYAGLAGGQVGAFALADGRKAWSRQLDTRVLLARGLFVHNGRVWACAESPAAVIGVKEQDGTPDLTIGFRRDEAAFRLPRLTDRPAWVPALGRLYVVVDDHTVHALDLGAGKSLWESHLDFSINRILASDDGRFAYAVPDSFLHNAQIVSLLADTGKVHRRRTVLGGSLTDAALTPAALYVAERDTDNALVVRALEPGNLAERWRAAPLPVAQPSPLAVGDRFVAIAGRHAGQRTAFLLDAATGRILGDASPRGASELSTALAEDLLVLATDRGVFAFGSSQREALDQRIAALGPRAEAGDLAALASLATALYQRGDERHAIAMLARACASEALSASDYATLKDQLNSLRESLAARSPATFEAAHMAVPPNIDGAIDEPWRADLAARLDDPTAIDEVQGIPISEARWRSPSDLSAVVYTGWDARYFYFAVDVTDDVHRTYTSQGETWIGDGLIISVDCENDGGYGYRFTSRDLLLTLALTRKDERRDDEGEDEPSGEYRVRLKEDNSGAVYEVALPWDYLGIEDPKPGLRFGFNVTVTDDDGDRAVKCISLTPGMILDRDRALMVRGFTPAYFGDVVLTGRPAGPAPLWTPPVAPRDDAVRVHRIRLSKEK
ncbi:MAG TPA: PQQ-binding-like beta-propeller repeat protein [Planctomycetota bacterium]|nr:PQQ-binding-like beta-propeller repeat protein [Planctomycetota bacterium]HRR82658.1 PQQ-binding-like beta-propeller repeat protein [Planctomycetota bacterium]